MSTKAFSNIRRTRREKAAALGAALAIGIARKINDPIYHQYEVQRQKFLKLKEMLIKKYGRRGAKQAKEAMMNKAKPPVAKKKEEK